MTISGPAPGMTLQPKAMASAAPTLAAAETPSVKGSASGIAEDRLHAGAGKSQHGADQAGDRCDRQTEVEDDDVQFGIGPSGSRSGAATSRKP